MTMTFECSWSWSCYKFNAIGDMMSRQNEYARVSNEPGGQRFIQSAARYRKKALSSKISDLQTRSKLPKSQTEPKINEALLGIQRMDNIITKKSNAGRPTQVAAGGAGGAGGSNSRLSMMSTASTLGSFTPKKV